MSGLSRKASRVLLGVLCSLALGLCLLRSTPAWAQPVPDPDASAGAPLVGTSGNQPTLDAIWIDVPREIGLVCGEPLAAPVRAALGCDGEGRAYWQSREVAQKGAAKAPEAAFRPPPPAKADLCEAVALLNDPDPKVAIAEPARRLLRLCNYRENPARKVQAACDEARLAPAAMARQARDYRDKLRCDTAGRDAKDRNLPAWNGDPASLPICADVLRYSEGLEGMPAVTALTSLCGRGAQKGSVLAAAAMIAAPVVEALGDFLSARAKEELTTFASEQLGRKFCEPTADKLNGQTLFPGTCAALFPRGLDEEVDLDFISSGRLQKVLAEDLRALPLRLLALGVVQAASDAEARQITLILTDLLSQLEAARASEASVLDFFAALEGQIRQELKARGLTPACVFAAGKEVPAPCAMMLFLTVAAKAKDVSPLGREPTPREATINGGEWIKQAAITFCATYGGRATAGAACLFGGFTSIEADFFQALRKVAEAAVAFHNDIGAIHARIAAARREQKLSLDVAVEVAAGTSSALRQLNAAMASFAQRLLPKAPAGAVPPGAVPPGAVPPGAVPPGAVPPGAVPPGAVPPGAVPAAARLAELRQTAELVDDILQAAAAAMKTDVREIAASLRIVLALPSVTARMSPAFKQGLRFMFDMLEARTRDDMRKVLEDNAAPLGSYKAKFEATTLRVTLNGFVGIFGGLGAPLFTRSSSAGYKAPDVPFLQPLAAPVGIDLSGPAFGGRHHLGATLTLIDPLALRITEAEDKATQADFSGVLTPGAFFRWGIFRSPIVFMVGARLQPLLASPERTCGTAGKEAPCWQGAVSGMAGFAVDLPLFPLN